MLDLTERIIVDRVIVRTEANVPSDYLPWAHAFVKIKVDLIGKGGLNRLAHRNWRQLEPKKNTHMRQFGEHTLFATEHDQGWILELNHELDERPDAYILSHMLAEFPILCPTLVIAANLAEASCPAPKSLVYWRSYW
jgi:hypothetical protein